MDKPFSTMVHRRQFSFFVASFTFLCIYAFDVRISSLDAVGVQVKLPEHMAKTVLFSASVFLFSRYFLDVISQLVFFRWHGTATEDVRKWSRLYFTCKMIRQILSVPASEFTVREFSSFIQNSKNAPSASRQQGGQLFIKLKDAAKANELTIVMPELIKELEDARPRLRSECLGMQLHARWNWFRSQVGFIPFMGALVFDVGIPIFVFDAVLQVGICDPIWLKYENWSFWWNAHGALGFFETWGGCWLREPIDFAPNAAP